MGKIRGIHPEFWTDEDIVELSLPARLLFIGLWNLACDNGHLDDKPKQIKMRILPSDDVDVDALLDELAWHKRIERKDGTITIRKFAEHQKPHRRWWKCCGPNRPECVVPEDAPPQGRNGGKGSSHEPDNRGTTVAQPLSHGSATADGDGEGDVEREGEVITASSAPKRATQRPDDFRPSQAHIDLANERGVDLRAEWAKFCDWSDANGKTYKDWPAALRNWIRNARPTLHGGNEPTRIQQHKALAQRLAEEELR
jgi:hypothetical protein